MPVKFGILNDIVALRRQRVQELRVRTPLEALERAAGRRTDYRDFVSAISDGGLSVIAEMKKASPSAGLLRRDYSCRTIAKEYEQSGASAISVLTEPDFFQGSLDDLRQARDATQLAALRKDFIVDEYQIYESVAAGADALLLIVAALNDATLRHLLDLATRLKISVLVEVHDRDELDRALEAGARIIGVNNRNLKTLAVDLNTSFRLRERIPSECLAVSESGISSPEDLNRLREAGFDAALIGEWFMKSPHPGRALAELLAGSQAELAPEAGAS